MSEIPAAEFIDRTGQRAVIRTACPDDAEPLLSYIHAVVGETKFFVIEPDELPATVEQERAFIQNHLDHPGSLLLLAETCDEIVGSARIEAGPYRRIAHRGNLSISVVRKWRNRGIGTALLQTLLDWAESNRRTEKVCLEVFATNAGAIHLYRKLGFVEEGRKPRDVKLGPDTYVDSLVMYRFVGSESMR